MIELNATKATPCRMALILLSDEIISFGTLSLVNCPIALIVSSNRTNGDNS